MGEFNGEDRAMLHNLDTRMAVAESKLSFIVKAISFIMLIIMGGVLAGIMNMVMK